MSIRPAPETTTCRVAASTDHATGRVVSSLELATPLDGLAPGLERWGAGHASIGVGHELAVATDRVSITATFRVNEGVRICNAATPTTVCQIDHADVTLLATAQSSQAKKTASYDAVRDEITWTLSLDTPGQQRWLSVLLDAWGSARIAGMGAGVAIPLPGFCVPAPLFPNGVCWGGGPFGVWAGSPPIGKAVARADLTLLRVEIVET